MPKEPFFTIVPAEELERRILNFQERLQQAQMDGAIIVQNADLYYFSGTIQQSHLFIPASGKPVLMARKDLERARQETALENVLAFRSPRQIPRILADHGFRAPRTLGLELDVLPAAMYLNFQSVFPDCRMADVSILIREVRSVKSAYEIEKIRQASRGSDHLVHFLRDHLVAGMTEIELAGIVEAEARRLGHQGIVRMRMWNNELFYGHIMAGPSAAAPSYLASPTGGIGVGPCVAQGAGLRPIGRNEPILMDFVFVADGYLCDQTRIFSIGNLPDNLARGHEAMLQVESRIKAAATPGVPVERLYEIARQTAGEKGFERFFMGEGERKIPFIGHGVGLELDELPILAKGQTVALAENMILAVEPKLIFPGMGVVGIENTHRVTRNGLETFSGLEGAVIVV